MLYLCIPFRAAPFTKPLVFFRLVTYMPVLGWSVGLTLLSPSDPWFEHL